MTDPPISLAGLVKQRRRWFNGSMFATFHVLSNMYRIWRRAKSSYIRNVFFMVLYLYIIIITALSFVLVGTFYAAFSIFLRAILPSDECVNITRTANMIENAYLFFLFLITLLSSTVQIDWAETGFRIAALFMG